MADLSDSIARFIDGNDDGSFVQHGLRRAIDSTLYRPGEGLGSAQEVRPKQLDEIVGQRHVLDALRVHIRSARRRNAALEHVLLTGPAGLGKTTIASVIASELGAGLIVDAGPDVSSEKLVAHVANVINAASEEPPLRVVIFIDEVHGLPSNTVQLLLPLLEDFRFVDSVIPAFTLVGATTDPAMLRKPLLERFSLRFHLDYYSEEEMYAILRSAFVKRWGLGAAHHASYLQELFAPAVREAEDGAGFTCEPSATERALRILARCAKGVPRIGLQLLAKARDYAIAAMEDEDDELERAPLTPRIVAAMLRGHDIDRNGLNHVERRILATILDRVRESGRPVGVSAIASRMGEDRDTIEYVYEPILVRLGYVLRTDRGRDLTPAGLEIASREITGETAYYEPGF